MIKIKRIVVPTDFSKVSLPAIRYALSLARDHGAEVMVLHAIPRDVVKQTTLGPYIGAEGFPFSAGWIGELHPPKLDVIIREKGLDLVNFLEQNIEPALLKAVAVKPVVRLGEVVDEIVAAAKELRSDLIVMTSRERSWLGRLFSKSLTQEVVRLAPCPVVSIQPWARVSTEAGKWVPIKQMQLASAATK